MEFWRYGNEPIDYRGQGNFRQASRRGDRPRHRQISPENFGRAIGRQRLLTQNGPALDQTAGIAERDLSISLAKANLMGIPLFLFSFLLVIVSYNLAWGTASLLRSINEFMRVKTLIPLVVSGVLLHEAMHAFGWMMFGRLPVSAMKFGLELKTLTPYAHCRIPMRASAYRAGVVLPAVVLGILPAAIGIGIHEGTLTLFGALFLGAACGDLLCLWMMRGVGRDSLVRDHPTRAGCLIVNEGPGQGPAGNDQAPAPPNG